MENFDFINKLLDGRIVFGAKEMINERLGLIPDYSTKKQFFNLKTDIKKNLGDGGSGSLSIKPICILKINGDSVDIISLTDEVSHEGILDNIPSLFSNVDINSLFKGFKS